MPWGVLFLVVPGAVGGGGRVLLVLATLGEVLIVDYEAPAVEIIGSVTDTTLVFDDGSLEEASR